MIFDREEISSWPEGFKKCSECRELRALDLFAKNPGGVLGRRPKCRACRSPEFKKMYTQRTFEDKLYVSAQYRANQRGIEFSITKEDIIIPQTCPILGVDIVLEAGSDYAPSLDRVVPSKGYIKGNVQVTSKRGNMLKNNMTLQEARLIMSWFEQEEALSAGQVTYG